MAKATQPNEEVKKTGFDLKLSTIKKLKYIGLLDDKFQNALMEEILDSYFKQWEKKNGKIPVK